ILVVGAHSAVREAEILHEVLLHYFAPLPGLVPADVVVLCADLDRAAPVIEGVFESAPPERRIPVAVRGGARGVDPLLAVVESIVAAGAHGVDALRLERLLRNAALVEALSLDETEFDTLLSSFGRAGALRGLDER